MDYPFHAHKVIDRDTDTLIVHPANSFINRIAKSKINQIEILTATFHNFGTIQITGDEGGDFIFIKKGKGITNANKPYSTCQ